MLQDSGDQAAAPPSRPPPQASVYEVVDREVCGRHASLVDDGEAARPDVQAVMVHGEREPPETETLGARGRIDGLCAGSDNGTTPGAERREDLGTAFVRDGLRGTQHRSDVGGRGNAPWEDHRSVVLLDRGSVCCAERERLYLKLYVQRETLF